MPKATASTYGIECTHRRCRPLVARMQGVSPYKTGGETPPLQTIRFLPKAGAYGMPLTGFGANIRCVHPTDSESCTAGADQWSPLQKLGCAYPKQRASLSAPPQVDFGDRKRKKSKETRLYSRVSFLDFVKVAQSQEVSQTFRKPTPPKTYISVCGLHKFCKPQGKFIKISQKPR